MGGMPMHPEWAMKLQLAAMAELQIEAMKFELEEPERLSAFGHLPRRDGFTHPLARRSRGTQAHRKRRTNRNHTSRRTRRKHRRAA